MSSEKNDDLLNRLKNISTAVNNANQLAASQLDEFYKDLPSRIDTILGSDQHLHRLKQLSDARIAWIKEVKADGTLPLDTLSFAKWLVDRWGLELTYNAENMGLTGFNVVDEQKHLLFCISFP